MNLIAKMVAKIAILILTFVFSLLMMSQVAFAQTENPGNTTVNAIELKGLGNKKGMYLSVYYALGKRATIFTDPRQLSLREVKVKRTLPITDDAVLLPKVDLSRSGIFLAYSIIVFVVHREPTFVWENTNGSRPEGEVTTPATASMLKDAVVDSLSKKEFEDLASQQNAAVISYTFAQ